VSIVLNHVVVPASDKAAEASFLAELLGLRVGKETGPFCPLRVNAELTLDFADQTDPQPGHYAFLVDDQKFDGVLDLLRRRPGLNYGSGPEHGWDREINHLGGGRGVYVQSPDGHAYEFFTAVP
jgi:catechol 2,3-dioxygenase-like lactoylglutathione lyase family enzyme